MAVILNGRDVVQDNLQLFGFNAEQAQDMWDVFAFLNDDQGIKELIKMLHEILDLIRNPDIDRRFNFGLHDALNHDNWRTLRPRGPLPGIGE